MSTLRPETVSVHVGNEPDPATGAVAPPIHLATTFRHGPSGERIAGYEYQREGNPPTTACARRWRRWKAARTRRPLPPAWPR